MRTAFVICGALAREVQDIIQSRGWDADIVGVSALDHLFPERIGLDVEAQLLALGDRYDRIIVVYGDCGSGGVLDQVLDHHGIQRVAGPNCYEMFSGPVFQKLLDEEPGTFVLTDFLARAFRGTVVRGLGLDQFPELKGDYFRNYQRVVYLAQTQDPDLWEKAERIADFLELPLEIRYTGYGLLEKRLVAMMESEASRSERHNVGEASIPKEPVLISESNVRPRTRLRGRGRWRRRNGGRRSRLRGKRFP